MRASSWAPLISYFARVATRYAPVLSVRLAPRGDPGRVNVCAASALLRARRAADRVAHDKQDGQDHRGQRGRADTEPNKPPRPFFILQLVPALHEHVGEKGDAAQKELVQWQFENKLDGCTLRPLENVLLVHVGDDAMKQRRRQG